MKSDAWEILYDAPRGEYDGRAIGGIRTTTVRAGRSLEVMCCPIIHWTRETRRQAKAKQSSEAMARINARNAQRRMYRLIEANFTPEAYVFTGTYSYPAYDTAMMDRDEIWDYYEREKLPMDMDAAKKDLRNFLNRVKYRVKKRGHSAKLMKWLYVIEEGAKEEAFSLPRKYHFHVIVEAPGLSRDEVEALWPYGFAQCARYDVKNDGAARLSRYFTKQKRGGRCWAHSRNMKEPTVRVSDRKISRRRAALIAEDVRRSGRDILESIYPGYKLMEEPIVTYSDFLPGAYIYARLRRRE